MFTFQPISCILFLPLQASPNKAAKVVLETTPPLIIPLLSPSKCSPLVLRIKTKVLHGLIPLWSPSFTLVFPDATAMLPPQGLCTGCSFCVEHPSCTSSWLPSSPPSIFYSQSSFSPRCMLTTLFKNALPSAILIYFVLFYAFHSTHHVPQIIPNIFNP